MEEKGFAIFFPPISRDALTTVRSLTQKSAYVDNDAQSLRPKRIASFGIKMRTEYRELIVG